MKTLNNYLNELKAKIKLLPTDIKWFCLFSVPLFFACTLAMIFAREQLYEKILPYTGWSPGFVYGILALIAFKKTSMTESNLENFIDVRRRMVFMFVVLFLFGMYDWFRKTPEFYNHTNPYLRYDPLRPIYGIFLPLIWSLIIGWPLMKKFFTKYKSKASA